MRFKNILIKVAIIVALLFSCLSLTFISVNTNKQTAYADDVLGNIIEFFTKKSDSADQDVQSIKKDMFMPVFHKTISCGSGTSIFESGFKAEQRQKINWEIATDQATKSYSLFDRFGGSINFVRYFGEENVSTGIIDKVYSLITQNKEDDFVLDDIATLITKEPSTYTNEFYDNRPGLKTANTDPRVAQYKLTGAITVSEDYDLGRDNYILGTSNTITSITSYLLSSDLSDTVFSLAKSLMNDLVTGIVMSILKAFLWLFGAALIFFILRNVFRFLKTGDSSIRKTAINFVGALISLALTFAIAANPVKFFDTAREVMRIPESLASYVISFANQNDPVICSDDPTNVMNAALWEKAVFLPWVRAVFGDADYYSLYTTFSDTGTKWELQSDAADAIGDISVPLGNGKSVKNWAALAYSCTSMYHLPALEKDKLDIDPNNSDEVVLWPKATLTTGADYIYIDDFRWLDASLKVGQYDQNSGSKQGTFDPYINYRAYHFKGYENAWASMMMALLMLPLLVLGVKKVWYFIRVLAGSVLILYRCCVNVIVPDKTEYQILANLKSSVLVPLIDYIFSLLMITLAITLYTTLADSPNILIKLIYLVLVIMLCCLRPRTMKVSFSELRLKFTKGAVKIKNFFKRNIRRLTLLSKKDLLRQASAAKKQETNDNIKKKQIENQEAQAKEEREKEALKYNGTLKKEAYLRVDINTALKKCAERVRSGKSTQENKKAVMRDQQIVKRLYEKLQGANERTAANTLLLHRANDYNKKLDKDIFGISENEEVYTPIDDEKEAVDPCGFKDEVIQKRMEEVERLNKEAKQLREDAESKKDQKIRKQMRDEADGKEKKADALNAKIRSEVKWNNAQRTVNSITGRQRGGALVSLKVKLIILGIVVVVWVLGMNLAGWFGI